MRIRPVDHFGYAPGLRGGVPMYTGPAPPAFTACGRSPPERVQAARRVTAHEAAATVPAAVNTAGQAPTFFASGCDPANAAT